ncbi:hypothetical protein BS78_08G154700 [Paspalum vaginatum]|nr:hypothetical protein BS78_08G154700 [Paspalum vaginatum]
MPTRSPCCEDGVELLRGKIEFGRLTKHPSMDYCSIARVRSGRSIDLLSGQAGSHGRTFGNWQFGALQELYRLDDGGPGTPMEQRTDGGSMYKNFRCARLLNDTDVQPLHAAR